MQRMQQTKIGEVDSIVSGECFVNWIQFIHQVYTDVLYFNWTNFWYNFLTKDNLMTKNEAIQKLKEFKEKNADKYAIDQIGIFGSLARDEARDDSDIDICFKSKVADMFMLVHIKDELSTLFSKSVDIVRVREKMNPYLKNRISKEAIYV